MMTTFYFDNSAQLLQVFLFLLGLFLSGITIQMWINLDSKSSLKILCVLFRKVFKNCIVTFFDNILEL